MKAVARDVFQLMILSAGARRVLMIRTGERSFGLVAENADEATADAAQERIVQIREKAASELPMTMRDTARGAVFAES
ncbi:hypothetical protein [Vannielia litorea]|uniref:Uncharacterized protein n=1 Tax=Vannielia litorea TaxID=1217970 RepID=A0A1N6GDP2_9RHOB|nr:hypothetical protein [Vannielia litorea]SIO05655.1 hypothetical protein SAMN05444002_2402 [Vannielia litorea]